MPHKLTKEEFIQKAQKVHCDKYDYSKVNYINNTTKICIICQTHGEFWQTPKNHLRGQRCPKCFGTHLNTKEEFIEKAKQVHGDKYDYSKVEYINNSTKVCIICQIHGEFWQTPRSHLSNNGCPKCANKNITTYDFIQKSKLIHKETYDYSKVEYVNSNKKVCMICQIHGEFWQTPNSHLNGRGCPFCKTSKLELEVKNALENKFKYEYNTYPSFLNGLQLDFYLPQYKIAIECQGIQHFKKSHFFEDITIVKERDERKRKLCQEHGIELLYYSNLHIDYPYIVYEDKNKLINKINEIKDGRKQQ